MRDTLAVNRRRWKARPRGAGPKAIQAATGARSLDAAQKQIARTFARARRIAEELAAAGSIDPVIAHAAGIQEILERLPALPLTEALKAEGRAGRSQDEASEDCLADGATPPELDLVITRSRAAIARLYTVVISAKARKAGLPCSE